MSAVNPIGNGSPYWFRANPKLTPKANACSRKAVELRRNNLPPDGPCIAPQDLFPQDLFVNPTHPPQTANTAVDVFTEHPPYASQSSQPSPPNRRGTYLDPSIFGDNPDISELLALTTVAYSPPSDTPPSDGKLRPVSDDQIDPILRLQSIQAQAIERMGFKEHPEPITTSIPMRTYAGKRTTKITHSTPSKHVSDNQGFDGHSSNFSEDDSDQGGTPDGGQASAQGSGRISEATRTAMDAAFDAIDNILEGAATKLGRTRENLIHHWTRRHKITQSTVSHWNMYQSFYRMTSDEKVKAAQYEEQHPEEVAIAANGKTFDSSSISSCWATFKLRNPTNWLEILETHHEMDQARKADKTILSRQRDFKKAADNIEIKMLHACRQHGFQGFFALVGNAVNEDAGLGKVFVTPGADGILEERLLVTHDSLVGQLKTHVFHCQSLDFTSDLERKRKVKMELDGDSDIEIVGPTASTSVSTGSFDDNLSAIRDSFLTMLNSVGISDKQLPWSSLGSLFAKKGIYLARWPEGVQFPGLTLGKKDTKNEGKTAAKKQGIKEIGSVAARRLLAAMQDPNRTPILLEAPSDDLLSSTLPVFLEAAPSLQSKSRRGRRAFMNGIIDNKGVKRLEAADDTSNVANAATGADDDSPSTIRRSTRTSDKKRKVSPPQSINDSPSPPAKRQKHPLIPPIATLSTRGAKRAVKSKPMVDTDDDVEDLSQAIKDVSSDQSDYDEGRESKARGKGKGKMVDRQADTCKGKGKAANSPAPESMAPTTKAIVGGAHAKGRRPAPGKLPAAAITGATAARTATTVTSPPAARTAAATMPATPTAGATTATRTAATTPSATALPTPTVQTTLPTVKTADASPPTTIPSKRTGPSGGGPPQKRLSIDKSDSITAVPRPTPRPIPRPKIQGDLQEFVEARALELMENYGKPRPRPAAHSSTLPEDEYYGKPRPRSTAQSSTLPEERLDEYEDPCYSPAPSDTGNYPMHDHWGGYQPPPDPRYRRPYPPMYGDGYNSYYPPPPQGSRYPRPGFPSSNYGGYPSPRGGGYPGYPVPPGSHYPRHDPRYPPPGAWQQPHETVSRANSIPDGPQSDHAHRPSREPSHPTEGCYREPQYPAEASGSGSTGA